VKTCCVLSINILELLSENQFENILVIGNWIVLAVSRIYEEWASLQYISRKY
jgi:hypothetical protein